MKNISLGPEWGMSSENFNPRNVERARASERLTEAQRRGPKDAVANPVASALEGKRVLGLYEPLVK